MKNECIDLADKLHQIKLDILATSNLIAGINKTMSLKLTELSQEVNSDKTLKNADARKAALSHLTSTNEEYINLDAELCQKNNEKALLEIEKQHLSDLLKIHLAFSDQ